MNHPQPYCPPLPQILADTLCGNPCDPCDPRRPMNPLAGIYPSHRNYPGHRHSSPDGDCLPFRITATHPVVPQPIMNYESCIMHCHTFSAKEKDSETGLSYFGSRYYSSDLSVWLSVDPMSDKYPSLSPYVYCADNPVKLVDPDGEEIVEDKPPGKISNFLTNLDRKVVGTSENRQFEGGSDGANQGTMTKQDVEAGVSVISTIVSAGTALEARGAFETTVAIVSAANSIDDATVNTSGQSGLQRATANSKGASNTVTFVKTASSVTSVGVSCRNVKNIVVKGTEEIKKNANKIINNVVSASSSAYSAFSSLFKKKKS